MTNKDLSLQIEQIEQQLSQFKSMINTQNHHQEADVSDLAMISTASPSVSKDIDTLQKTVSRLEKAVTDLTTKVDGLVTETTSSRSTLERMTDEVEDLKANKANKKDTEQQIAE